MKKNLFKRFFTKKTIFAILFLVILCFGIFWFGVRPANIKKECAGKAREVMESYTNSDYITLYEYCKASRGL